MDKYEQLADGVKKLADKVGSLNKRADAVMADADDLVVGDKVKVKPRAQEFDGLKYGEVTGVGDGGFGKVYTIKLKDGTTHKAFPAQIKRA